MHCFETQTVVLQGQVTQVCAGYLMVCDQCTGQVVQVNTTQAGCFQVGDWVRVTYNGAMTNSIPPQISAQAICKVCCC